MKYFVTGGTGFIGSHFIATQAAENEIHALVRGEDGDAARARLAEKLEVAAGAYPVPPAVDPEEIHCVLGDVEKPALGLDEADLRELREAKIDAFWHFAANLNFEEERATQIANTNIAGVEHALALAAELGVEHFVHTSTAYTAGVQAGEIPEELHDPAGPFNNAYEESKCRAEHIVAEFCRRRGIRFSILRPSVVIGVSTTKRSGGTTTGMYAFARDLYFLRRVAKDLDIEPGLTADPEMVVNFNPIDGVMRDIQYLIDNDFPHGPIYHLTASYGFKVREGVDLGTAMIGLERFRFVDKQEAPRTPIDELIGKRSEFYRSYVFHGKDFRRSIPMRHGCTLEELRGYVASYLAELDRRYSTTQLTKERIAVSDGVEIDTYALTDPSPREAILIVTAFGMPVDFWLKFIELAGQEYDVFTWETRYLPGPAPLGETDISVDRHVLDGIEILDRHGVERAHVIGWCTGAKLALKMAGEHGDRVSSLTTLSGGFNIRTDELKTDYERGLTDILLKIADNPRFAELYFDLIYGGEQEGGESETVRTLLHGTNANYIQYTSLPFRSTEGIIRYSDLITTFYEDVDLSFAEAIDVPTLVMIARTDGNTHPNASRRVAEMVPGARYLEFEDGDHYLMDSQADGVFARFREHAHAAAPAGSAVGEQR